TRPPRADQTRTAAAPVTASGPSTKAATFVRPSPLLDQIRRFYRVRDVARYQPVGGRGRQRAGRSRMVICGLARDVLDTLPALMQQCHELAACFADCRFVVYENDSTDGTQRWLQQWQLDSHGHGVLISERLKQPRWPAQRLAARADAL